MIRLACIFAFIAAVAGASAAEPVSLSYEVVNVYPHDPEAFTQGLFFKDGALYETTGQYGQSTIRRINLVTGAVEKKRFLPAEVFGEGSVAWGSDIIVLTWRAGQGYVLDAESFKVRRRFKYEGEGWGLTHDGARLIISDGTQTLRFLDPQTLQQTGSVDVTYRGAPLTNINELEWVEGKLLANVWGSEAIVRINLESGAVEAVADMRGLLSEADLAQGGADVLNGIAYDPATSRLFVTGKYWPKIFEVKLTDPEH